MLLADVGDEGVAHQVVLGTERTAHVDVDALVVDHAGRDIICGEVGVITAGLQMYVGRRVVIRDRQLRIQAQRTPHALGQSA